MKKSIALILSTSAASLLSACLFQNAPDSQAKSTAKFEIRASSASSSAALVKSSAASDLTLGDSSGVQFTLTEAKVMVARIQLESETGTGSACDSSLTTVLKKHGDSTETENEKEVENEKECEDDQELSIKGPFIIDLLTGISTPDLGAISVPAGTYTKIKIRLGHGIAGDSAAMNGYTLIAKGSFSEAGAAPQPINIALRLNEDLKIENKQGLQLDGSTVHTILVQLMAGDWLKGMDFSRCLGVLDSASAGKAIEVNEDSDLGKCLDVEHALKGNFRNSFHADEKNEQETEKDSVNETEKEHGSK